MVNCSLDSFRSFKRTVGFILYLVLQDFIYTKKQLVFYQILKGQESVSCRSSLMRIELKSYAWKYKAYVYYWVTNFTCWSILRFDHENPRKIQWNMRILKNWLILVTKFFFLQKKKKHTNAKVPCMRLSIFLISPTEIYNGFSKWNDKFKVYETKL